ncbi:MAG TPA: tetratricopeptide repeat protein [Rhodanobacteraceae bacterium]|nr:tetratricopeptide repeat protein [Rhodanobacteraceae bacterium]
MLAAALLCWIAYAPGLHGGFLFDDFANLPTLGAYGRVDDFATFLRYITSGTADPTGRPIALLSFLIDANTWPADPLPFKRTALILHLVNGLLLFALLTRLGRYLADDHQRTRLAAALGAALWLLHPLFVSTTLYIVQREAMLPATFVLLGLIGFVHGRELAERGSRGGVWLAAVSVTVFTLLAALSKANGALLPLFAWIVDAVLLRRVLLARAERAFAKVRSLLLVAPSVVLFAYVFYEAYAGVAHGILAERPWTLGQRLLTEPRVIVDYLGLLWFPRPFSTGLFNDAIEVSTGLLSPPSTLASIVFIAGLLALGFAARRRHPALAFAVLFYFAGQLLESTSIPLELYFEHRNYLPAMPMFWPLAIWLCSPGASRRAVDGAAEASKDGLAFMRLALIVVLPLGFAAMTYLRADLWGNRDEQAALWAERNVDSPRAQAYAAQIESARGQKSRAIARLDAALAKHPDEIQLALNLVGIKCEAKILSEDDLARARTALATTRNLGRLGYEWFEQGLPAANDGRCPPLDLAAIDALIDAASSNPTAQSIRGRQQDLLSLRARVALLRGDADAALAASNAAFDADPRPGAALKQAAILASAGFPEQAMRHLDHFRETWHPPSGPGTNMQSLHDWLLWRQGYWSHEIDHLRSVIAGDLDERARTRSGAQSQ